MPVPQAVVPQLGSVTQTLKDGVHEALEGTQRHAEMSPTRLRSRRSALWTRGGTHRVAQVPQSHQALRTLVLGHKQRSKRDLRSFALLLENREAKAKAFKPRVEDQQRYVNSLNALLQFEYMGLDHNVV